MTPRSAQAIAGLSAGAENTIMRAYPSIACTALGRALGRLYNSIPIRINGILLSHLLFPLPTSPIALLIYILLKIGGRRYLLTNRSVQVRRMLGDRLLGEAPLPSIDDIEVVQSPGQRFYRAADLVLYDSSGEVLLRLDAVTRGEIFAKIILEARDARARTEAALATISARQPA